MLVFLLLASIFCAHLGGALGETAANTLLPEETQALSQQETIIEDFENGYWFYEDPSQGLRIEIYRHELTDIKMIWYEADIRTTEKTPIQLFAANPDNPGKGFMYAERIVRSNQLVFAINDDQFGHRVYNRQTVGIIVRNGSVLSDKTKASGKVTLPNLDVGAFFPDGSMRVFQSAEYTGDEYLDMGVENTLCFGPYILRDGEINPDFQKYYRIGEPRCAIGMIEPYHYMAIMVEGRITRAQGASLQWLGERMQELGVIEAINLDGGETASILFMGKKLEVNNPTGRVRKTRSLSGVVGLGISEKVPEYEGVGK